MLSAVLFLGPIAAAFASHNWDLKATVVPSEDEISAVKDRLGGIFEENISSEEVFDIRDSTVEPDEMEAIVDFNSPFHIDVKIKEISGKVFCRAHGVYLGSIHLMEEEVSVPADGKATFHVIGEMTSEGYQHVQEDHGGELPDIRLSGMVFELEAYGVKVRVENVGGG